MVQVHRRRWGTAFLDRLGGTAWGKGQGKAKSIFAMAEELIRLYAIREALGNALRAARHLVPKFEAAFE